MNGPLRVLILEDRPADAELMLHELREAGFDPEWSRVDSEDDFIPQLDDPPDIILADYSMPGFDSARALEILQARDLNVPLIVVTGSVSEEAAVECMKRGAADYLLKDRLARLGLAVSQALEKRRLREENRRTDEERRRLLSRLVVAQEEERNRIAADIHDDSIQVMTALGLRLDVLRRSLTDPGQIEAIAGLAAITERAIARLRHLSFQLRPRALDSEGLVPALHLLLAQASEDAGFAFQVENELGEEPPEQARVILYRLALEAISNVRKHARASRLDVLVAPRDDGFLLRIVDDGVGFTPAEVEDAPGHLGLATMKERAEIAGGSFTARSAPGSGTTIEFWIPVS